MNWKQYFSETILKRGRQYYDSRKVMTLSCSDDGFRSVVLGNDFYDVSIGLKNGRLSMHCNCPYSRDGYRCKHMAAVLYKIEKQYGFDFEKYMTDSSPNINSSTAGKKGKPAIPKRERIYPFKDWASTDEDYCYFDIPEITKDLIIYEDVYKKAEEIIRDGRIENIEVEVLFEGKSLSYFTYDYSDIDTGCICKVSTVITDNKNRHPMLMKFSKDKLIGFYGDVAHCTGDAFVAEYAKNKYEYRYGYNYAADVDDDPYGHNGLCEHKVALLIKAMQFIKSNKPADATDRDGMSILNSFKSLISTNSDFESEGESQNEITSEIRLEPQLLIEGGEIEVNYKIGRDKLFVLKDVNELEHAVSNKDEFKLGKSTVLDFSREHFDEKSYKHYKLLCDIIEQKRNWQSGYSRYYVSELQKELPLFGSNLDEFFEIENGNTVALKPLRKNGRTEIKLREGSIKLRLNIAPHRDKKGIYQGIDVRCRLAPTIEGRDYSYAVDNHELVRISAEDMEKIKPFADASYGDDDFKFRVGRKNAGKFVERVLPTLGENAVIRFENEEMIRGYIPPDPEYIFYLDIQDGLVECRCDVLYGEKKHDILDWVMPDKAVDSTVDEASEGNVLRTLYELFPILLEAENCVCCENNSEQHIALLDGGLDKLMKIGEVNATDRFKAVQLRRSSKIQIGVAIESNLLDLKVSSDEMEYEELVSILMSYRKKQKYHRLRDGNILKLDGSELEELSEILDSMNVSVKEFASGKMHVPAYRALYLDKMLEQNNAIAFDRDRTFRKLVKEFKTVGDADFEAPKCYDGILRSYQQYGHKWLRTLETYGFGGILADEMGLGKTIQLISILESARQESRMGLSLVVCPASLVYNWKEEFEKFGPELRVKTVTGSVEERKAIIDGRDSADVFITSYDLLKRDIHEYDGIVFKYEIIDEAQYIKNHNSLAAKAVKVIEAEHRFALTGTPIENRLSELWSIFDYLMPGFLYGYDTFRKSIEVPVTKDNDEQAVNRLKMLATPFILRRLKSEVLTDLPEKIEKIQYAKLDDEQKKLYEGQVIYMKGMLESQSDADFATGKIRILAELMKIRQICCDPSLTFDNYQGESAKREMCIELIKEAISGEHKILLFSQFTSMLDILADELKKEGVSYYMITGQTTKEKRIELVNSFNSDSTEVFLISLKAGGTGLNLTGADVVIHYDPWWNVAAENQATDRAHRIGQEKVVTVYKLIAKDTIEEKIIELQQKKKELADEIINGESSGLMNMSREELLGLLEQN